MFHRACGEYSCTALTTRYFPHLQLDVTQEVLAQRGLRLAQEKLEADKERMALLLQRQYDLIQCVTKVDGFRQHSTHKVADELLLSVLQQMAQSDSAAPDQDRDPAGDSFRVLHMLGEGNVGVPPREGRGQ